MSARHESLARQRPLPGLPPATGVGLRAPHCRALLEDPRPPAFVEVHAENYFCDGGPAHRYLDAIHARCALSVHGVGLSLGGRERPCPRHLAQLSRLLDRHAPESFSEHLAWTQESGVYLNDLLPVAYDVATLRRVCAHVDEVQRHLGLRLLLENPATYVRFDADALAETQFLAEVQRATGCGLLLDLGNVVVSCANHGWDLQRYLAAFPLEAVGEIHLAGHARRDLPDGSVLLIDSHDRVVPDEVLALLHQCAERVGPVPTLVEWDAALPAWDVLAGEAARAQRVLDAAATAAAKC
jgi:uncharacterized protein